MFTLNRRNIIAIGSSVALLGGGGGAAAAFMAASTAAAPVVQQATLTDCVPPGSGPETATGSGTPACAGVNVSVGVSSITLTLSTGAIAMSDDGDHLTYNGTPNEDWNVYTNDANGYTLNILGDSGSTAFVNTLHAGDTIPDSTLRIQDTVNGGSTTTLSGTGQDYTNPGPSLAAGDAGSDLWLLRGLSVVPASGTYTQVLDYEAIQN